MFFTNFEDGTPFVVFQIASTSTRAASYHTPPGNVEHPFLVLAISEALKRNLIAASFAYNYLHDCKKGKCLSIIDNI